MIQKVFKYGTGQEIPEGAIYLCTKVQRFLPNTTDDIHCWLVWHYFLVNVEE